MMHFGSYDDEPESLSRWRFLQKMKIFLESQKFTEKFIFLMPEKLPQRN